MKRLLATLAGLAAAACAHAPHGGVPAGPGPVVVTYKAELGEGRAAARGAKIALWAEEPDRLHAEVLAPVGGVTFTLDAGGGRVCLVDVAGGVAYTGDDGPDALAALVGVRVTTADAVAALLRGVAPAGLTVTRDGPDGGLPSSLLIADGERRISLTRAHVDRGRLDTSALGTGLPPDHLPVRPLAGFARE